MLRLERSAQLFQASAVAAHAVAVAVDLHEGNAGLNYRSVLAREVSGEEAELYRRPGHRRRLRRVRPGDAAGDSV